MVVYWPDVVRQRWLHHPLTWIPELDLRKLEHFVAVAEEGTFTRAAARLHMSQQALSTSIRALEREIGVDLLQRTSTGVTVLPAGEALVEDARVLHGVARSAVRRARRIGRDAVEPLRVGHTPAVTGGEVNDLLRQVQVDHPELVTEVNQRYPDELTGELLAGDLEIGLCRAMTPAHGLASATLTLQRLHLAVAADHRLAGRDVVGLSDVADEEIVVWGTPGRSGYTDLLLGICRDAGFEPRTRRNPVQGTPPATAVVGTDQVAFVTGEPGPAAHGDARIVELRPAVHVPLQALWPHHLASTARDAFLRCWSQAS